MESGWVMAAQSGDRDAMAALLQNEYAFMFRLAYRYTGNRAEAEDVTQDACIKLARRIGDCREPRAFRGWLVTLVLNTARDAQRRNGTREGTGTIDAAEANIASTPAEYAIEDRLTVQREVTTLSHKLRDAVLLVYWVGLSQKEAAVALGVAEGTVNWRLHEARRILGARLEGEQADVA